MATVEPETATLQDDARRGGIAGAPTPLPPPGSTVKVAIATPTGTYSVSFISARTYAQTAANLIAAISRAEATPTNTA